MLYELKSNSLVCQDQNTANESGKTQCPPSMLTSTRVIHHNIHRLLLFNYICDSLGNPFSSLQCQEYFIKKANCTILSEAMH